MSLTKPQQREPLYQVWVETTDGEPMPVSPKLIRPVADAVLEGARLAINTGARPEWGNPHLVRATTIN